METILEFKNSNGITISIEKEPVRTIINYYLIVDGMCVEMERSLEELKKHIASWETIPTDVQNQWSRLATRN